MVIITKEDLFYCINNNNENIPSFIINNDNSLIETGLPPFAGAKTGRKNIRVPPLIFRKKIISQFCKQYTYLTNLKVYLVFDF